MRVNKKRIKKACVLIITAGIILTMPGITYAADTGNKEENVYASLNADGSVKSLYVVNEYTLQTDQTLTDYGKYSSVRNITTDDEIKIDGEIITLQGHKGKYYYQGNLETKELPWSISVKYFLDGREIEAEALGGKSGSLEILISTGKNAAVDASFFENYLLQGKVLLDTGRCKNIKAEGATVASVGSDKQLLYNIMPDKEKEYQISADVTDFRMDGISFSAVPVSFDIDRNSLNTDEIDTKITDLQDAVTELDDGALELKDGAKELHDGAYDLHDGSIDFFDGATDLNDGAVELDDGARKLLEGAQELCDGSGSLQKGMYEINDGLGTLDGKSQELKDGSGRLKSGTDALVAGINGAAISEAEIAGMVQSGVKTGVADALQAAGITDPTTIETISSQASQAIATGIGQNMSAAITTKMQPLAEGAASLQSGAASLNTGVNDYTGAVGQIRSGSQTACEGMGKLRYGISELKDGTVDLKEGTEELLDGTNDLVDGAVDLYDGTKELYEGTGELVDGTGELTDGTNTFKTETSDLDVQVDDEIDEALKKVSGGDFTPISFVSAKNQNVTSVQFAMTTDPIEAPEPETVVTPEVKQTFWQKFIGLFKK
ncbi:MAG: hypothetical protein Q4G60_02055 [bacterium]|nr:hypothetical protein [bacterium]